MSPREWRLDGQALRIGPATISEILPLRQRVLRIGFNIEEARFPEDDAPATLHGAVFHQSRAVSCATLILASWEGKPAWQLRGMATEDAWRGRGLGGALLDYLLDWAMNDSPIPQRITTFWCNARVPAVAFYQRLGWTVESEEFDIPTAGPHRRMFRQL